MNISEFPPGIHRQSFATLDGSGGKAAEPVDLRTATREFFARNDLSLDPRFRPSEVSKSVFFPQPDEWLKSPEEQRLKGTVAVISGGTDGIGLAASYLAAGEGARVVTCHLTDKSGEVGREIQADIEGHGGQITVVQADLASVVGYNDFYKAVFDAVDLDDSPISFFSPSAAAGAGKGQTPEYAREVNYEVPRRQVVQFSPFMGKGATIVYPQSEPGQFLDDPSRPELSTEALQADQFGEIYLKVAGPKHDLVGELLDVAAHMPAFKNADIRFRVVVANAVLGTKLWRGLQMSALRDASGAGLKRVEDLLSRTPDGKFPTHLDMGRAMLNTAFDGQPSGTITYVGLNVPQSA